MVIKGGARGGASSLAAHLQRIDTNERMEIRELRGVVAEDLDGALSEIEAVASGARSQRPFYHASINTRADEVLAPEQWFKAIDRLEQELDLVGQPRAVVAHVKEGRAHVHIVWSRIDLETMKAIPDSHNYRQHELVSRELEREFGHARVQGAHIEREGAPRPARTPTHAEMQQAARTGLTPGQAKAQLTQIWNRTDSGKAFAAAIDEAGWTLARGDRRDFVVLDPSGGTHSLARRIAGAGAQDVRDRMADIDRSALPSVAEARAQYESRLIARREVAADLAAPPSGLGGRPPQEEVTPPRPAIATTHGGMVAQQREANWLMSRHQAAREVAVGQSGQSRFNFVIEGKAAPANPASLPPAGPIEPPASGDRKRVAATSAEDGGAGQATNQGTERTDIPTSLDERIARLLDRTALIEKWERSPEGRAKAHEREAENDPEIER